MIVKVEREYENKFLVIFMPPNLLETSDQLYKNKAGKERHTLEHKSLRVLYSSLVLPHLNYRVEAWGNTYKSNSQSLCVLQKRAVRIERNVGYRGAHKHTVFKVARIEIREIRERKNSLPGNTQNMFCEREGGVII